METFIFVLDIIISGKYLQLGDVIRIERSSIQVLKFIRNHPFLWKSMSRMCNLKSAAYKGCIRELLKKKKCRECGNDNAKRLTTTQNNVINVCETCFLCNDNYSALLSRNDIIRSVFSLRKTTNLWSYQLRQLLNGLHLALRGKHNTYYYWAFEWKTPMRAFSLKRKCYNKHPI